MMGTTEETLKRVFTEATKKENVVERVKIIRDFAFVHFTTREDAVVAKNKLDGMFDHKIILIHFYSFSILQKCIFF